MLRQWKHVFLLEGVLAHTLAPRSKSGGDLEFDPSKLSPSR